MFSTHNILLFLVGVIVTYPKRLCEGRQTRGNLGWGSETPVVSVTMAQHQPHEVALSPSVG